MLGGVNEDEWQMTVDWFGGRCAYTGEELAEGETDRDHAIPMSSAHCGLHLYGNVLPATREANGRKAGKHYRDFVEDPLHRERHHGGSGEGVGRKRIVASAFNPKARPALFSPR